MEEIQEQIEGVEDEAVIVKDLYDLIEKYQVPTPPEDLAVYQVQGQTHMYGLDSYIYVRGQTQYVLEHIQNSGAASALLRPPMHCGHLLFYLAMSYQVHIFGHKV